MHRSHSDHSGGGPFPFPRSVIRQRRVSYAFAVLHLCPRRLYAKALPKLKGHQPSSEYTHSLSYSSCDSPPTDADRLPPFVPRRAGGCCERPSLMVAPRPKSRESSSPDRETVQIHWNGKPKDHSRFSLRLTPRPSVGMKKGPAWVQHLAERLRHLTHTPSRREKDSVRCAPQAG